VAEWSIAAVLKTAKAKHLRGFESLPLRQKTNVKKYILGIIGLIAASASWVGAQTNVATSVVTTAATTVTNVATNAAAQTAARTATRSSDGNYLGLIIWGAIILAVFFFLWSKGYLVKIRAYVAETQEELKKCSWPSREELKGSTVVVMVTIALLGLFTVGVDWILSSLMRLIT
jgi:preprotein translocase SecE subunit